MTETGGIHHEQLTSFVARIENLEADKAEIAGDLKEVYEEAKGAGFDTKIIRKLVKERRRSKADRDEEETLLDLYRHALGMLATTPLGEAALERASAAA